MRFPVALGQVPCGRVGQPSEDENPRVRPALGLVFEEQECVFPSSWNKSRAEESDSLRKTKTLLLDLLSASSSRSKSAFSRRPGTRRAEESDSVGRRKPSCSTCSRPRLRGARVHFPVVLGQVPVRKSRTASEGENPRVRAALGLVFEEQECVFPSP